MLVGIITLVIIWALMAIIGKAIKISFPVVKKLIINGILGAIGLFIFNIFGNLVGINIDFNAINALVAGFFVVPGIILLLILA